MDYCKQKLFQRHGDQDQIPSNFSFLDTETRPGAIPRMDRVVSLSIADVRAGFAFRCKGNDDDFLMPKKNMDMTGAA